MQQLEINAKEMDNICEELQNMEESIDKEYDSFSNQLNTQRRQQQEENAKDVLKNAKSIDEARRVAAEKEAAALAVEQAAAANMTEPKKIINQLITKVIPPQGQPAPISMSVTIDPNNPNPKMTGKLNVSQGVKNSISLNEINNNKTSNANAKRPTSKSPNNFKFSDTQDEEFNRFLEDPFKGNSQTQLSASNNQILPSQEDDDDDASGNNPMVAAFKETLDSSDEDMSSISKKLNNLPINLDK